MNRIKSGHVSQQHRKVLGLQLGVAMMISGAVYFLSPESWQALMAGSAIGITYSLMLGETAKIADRMAITDPKMSMVVMYGGAVFRFLVIGGMLGAAFFTLRNEPLAIILPFIGILVAPTFMLIGKKRLTD